MPVRLLQFMNYIRQFVRQALLSHSDISLSMYSNAFLLFPDVFVSNPFCLQELISSSKLLWVHLLSLLCSLQFLLCFAVTHYTEQA